MNIKINLSKLRHILLHKKNSLNWWKADCTGLHVKYWISNFQKNETSTLLRLSVSISIEELPQYTEKKKPNFILYIMIVYQLNWPAVYSEKVILSDKIFTTIWCTDKFGFSPLKSSFFHIFHHFFVSPTKPSIFFHFTPLVQHEWGFILPELSRSTCHFPLLSGFKHLFYQSFLSHRCYTSRLLA